MATTRSDSRAGGEGRLDCSRMRNWEIGVAPDAIPSEEYAAQEFQRWFGEATGIHLPIRSGQDAPDLVRIGSALPADALGEEGLRIAVEKDRLSIVGGRPRGTLYGVYQFLEDFLGVRFLTHDHTHVPDATASSIPCGTCSYVPPLSYRYSYYFENSEHPEFAARLRVNTVTDEERLGGKTRQNLINHSVGRLVPFDRFGKTGLQQNLWVKNE